MLAWRVGDPIPRHSFAVVWNRLDNKTYEATVDLTGDAVLSIKHIPDVTPNFTVDEYHEVDGVLRQHPDVIAKLRERGITDMSRVIVDVWTYGKALMPEKYRDRRLGWCDVWVRAAPDGNPYAHPVSGLKVLVDMNTLELLEIEDEYDVGMPAVDGEYVPGPWKGEARTDLKPLHITQPEGTSFTLDGAELRWQNWSMRLGFNYREGPVIYQVGVSVTGRRRPVRRLVSLRGFDRSAPSRVSFTKTLATHGFQDRSSHPTTKACATTPGPHMSVLDTRAQRYEWNGCADARRDPRRGTVPGGRRRWWGRKWWGRWLLCSHGCRRWLLCSHAGIGWRVVYGPLATLGCPTHPR